MSYVQIEYKGKEYSVNRGSTAFELFSKIDIALKPIALRWNNQLTSLHTPLIAGGTLEPVDLNSSAGHRVYRKSLCFLLEKAERELFPKKPLHIGPSMGDGYLFFPESETDHFSPKEIEKLKTHMLEDIASDQPFLVKTLCYTEALRRFEAQNQTDTRLLLSERNEALVPCIQCGDYWDLMHFPLAPSAASVGLFDLLPYHGGLLLHFPGKSLPLTLSPFVEKPLLTSIFHEYKRWGRIMEVPSVPHLNQISSSKEISRFIQVAETFQEKKISQLADQIYERREQVRVVLIAGPSSSGKTTFTKKLAIHLQVCGLAPRMISLDDYFLNREDTPKDAEGKYDFEALEALDRDTLNRNLVDLLAGKEVSTPHFDFSTGTRRETGGPPLRLASREILMIEGIHGLNDALTPLIPKEKKFRIYISALTQLNLDNHNRISTTDNRLIRRLVRDYQFRGYSALHTLQMWPSVRRGEDKNIFPHQDSADGVFNSSLDYELSVLRTIAIPLLKTVQPIEKEYTTALELLHFLENFTPIDPKHVPLHSLLREFLGDSGFKY